MALQELAYVAELTGAKAFITVQAFHDFQHVAMGREVQAKVPSLSRIFSYQDLRDMIREPADTPRLDAIPIDANDIFTICWTSGTEAQPKGCPLSHNNWRCQADMAAAAGMEPKDTLLTAGPLVNMGGGGHRAGSLVPLGRDHRAAPPLRAHASARAARPGKDQLHTPGSGRTDSLSKHPAAADVDLSSIRAITVGSAPPSLWSMQEFKKRWNIDIGNIWGQNEAPGVHFRGQGRPGHEPARGSLPEIRSGGT